MPELVVTKEIPADGYVPRKDPSSSSGRTVRLPMLAIIQPIEVEISLYA